MAPSANVTAALTALQARWGAAAPRSAAHAGPQVIGALATVPLPATEPAPDLGRIVPTGFAALDAILGPGGLPRTASVSLRGDHSSGKTTLALRLVAEAQASGAIVAYLDLARSLDPVEAVARGVRLEWLVVLTPESIDEGLVIAGSLLQARAVDLLLVDLPPERSVRPAKASERFARLAALARRAETLFVVLEPPGLPSGLAGAIGEAVGLRLELDRRAWIRLGRDVVGQRTEVLVARNRFGPPGRRAELRILYADGGDRDACLRRDRLLVEASSLTNQPRTISDATPPPLLASSGPPARSSAARAEPIPLHPLPERPGRARRPAVDGRSRPRREPRRAGAGRAAGNAPRSGPPARA